MLYFDDIQFGKPYQAVARPGEIVLEAESATSITAPMAIYDDPLASGGKYIGTPSTATGSTSSPPTTGVATYSFTVAGGVYKVWFRVGPVDTGTNDSLWVRIKDATIQPKGSPANPGWVRANNLSLQPGSPPWLGGGVG